MTDSLAAFLAARLDEDEAAARDWQPDERWPDEPGEMDVRWYYVPTYTPARVLREVAAKRAILAEHARARNEQGDTLCFTCTEGPWPCKTIRHLLAVDSDHPDYDPAWLLE